MVDDDEDKEELVAELAEPPRYCKFAKVGEVFIWALFIWGEYWL